MATSETPRLGDFGGGIPLCSSTDASRAGSGRHGRRRGGRDDSLSQHLLSLGHRSIAHVAGPTERGHGPPPLARIRGRARGGGLEAPARLVAETSFDEAGGHVAATRLLRLEPRPTAIFVANVRAAIGALAAARRLGLRVPGDVSVVGLPRRSVRQLPRPSADDRADAAGRDGPPGDGQPAGTARGTPRRRRHGRHPARARRTGAPPRLPGRTRISPWSLPRSARGRRTAGPPGTGGASGSVAQSIPAISERDVELEARPGRASGRPSACAAPRSAGRRPRSAPRSRPRAPAPSPR